MRRLKQMIRRMPFILYGLVAISGYGVIDVLSSFGHGYDDRGIGTAAFLASLVWNVIAFPFWFTREALCSLNGGHAGVVSISIVVVLLLVLDCLWRHYSSTEESSPDDGSATNPDTKTGSSDLPNQGGET